VVISKHLLLAICFLFRAVCGENLLKKKSLLTDNKKKNKGAFLLSLGGVHEFNI